MFACISYLQTILANVIFACIWYLPTILARCHFCLYFVLTNHTCQCHFCSIHDPLQSAWCQFPVVLFVLSPYEEQSISKMFCRKFMMICPFFSPFFFLFFFFLNVLISLMSSSARSSLLFSILKNTSQATFFRVLERVKVTNLLWFGDNNNYELTIIEG